MYRVFDALNVHCCNRMEYALVLWYSHGIRFLFRMHHEHEISNTTDGEKKKEQMEKIFFRNRISWASIKRKGVAMDLLGGHPNRCGHLLRDFHIRKTHKCNIYIWWGRESISVNINFYFLFIFIHLLLKRKTKPKLDSQIKSKHKNKINQ